ncbi:flagellar motor protein MotB [Roseinatronobacter sp.]|uniref:flagellar motor protein MotB n=1 Tax=Roseinatronobacter sp. TaxID=1945755 RepID=UPI0025CC797D|nr:flagellar motor protein MotB [Rhodobaca sp.]
MPKADNVRPIIIKRKKVVVGGGHHGGAWKVAYADFVTAMMAFFLMLWLLGSVTEEKRQGIADYFSDTYAVRSDSAGGRDLFGGVSLSLEDSITDEIATKEEFVSEILALETVMDTIKSLAMQDAALASAFEHLLIRMTEEGLIIELFDLEHRSLFEDGTNHPKPVLEFLIEAITNAFQTVVNSVAIDAHSRSFPSVFLENPVWPASLDRARKVHQMMELSGLSESRFQRVTGHADRTLVDPVSTAMRNNRIELTLLRKSGTPAPLGGN